MISRPLPLKSPLALAGFLLLSPCLAIAGGTLNSLKPVNATVNTGAPDADILDNFDDNNDRNFWNGDMGAMEEVDGDGSIQYSYSTTNPYGGAGRSLRLAYDLNQSSSWNGFYLNLSFPTGATKNISGYKKLSFKIRGDSVGLEEHLKIGLENTGAVGRNRAYLYVADYLDGGVTNGWQSVEIPLDAFTNLDSKTNAKTLTFVFERAYANQCGLPLQSVVYVDDIRFSAASLGSVRIDHFGDNWGWGALGGNQGETKDDNFPVQTVSHSYELTPYAGAPRSYQSNYSVTDSWVGHYFLFGGGADGNVAIPSNMSAYNTLNFSLKALDAAHNPGVLKIELKSEGRLAVYIVPVTTAWVAKSINLVSGMEAGGAIDKATLREMTIIYESWRIVGASGDKAGTVYFDDFSFAQ